MAAVSSKRWCHPLPPEFSSRLEVIGGVRANAVAVSRVKASRGKERGKRTLVDAFRRYTLTTDPYAERLSS
ncbi:hypothetical protein EYF80_037427 [Liparis tanakae]|uniref:Uncharacterized protein n=1 Tax=Liparis tanakae TaxID=230148 RepID=A0A4Z2GHV3_9TELE|nr:hypothetical protein EYF80_037427 [Liparis tanakae]